MPDSVFLTGASGFVGSAISRTLLRRGYRVHALVNRCSPAVSDPSITLFQGSLSDQSTLDRALQGCRAAIHVVGIIMEKRSEGITFERIHVEGTRSVVEAAKQAGVPRFIQMSALGSRPNAASEYHRTKYEAEQVVQKSGLKWTIFRPSLIHGPGGEFMQMESRWARHQSPPFLFMPYFGAGLLGFKGSGKLQPVFVDDVAKAFVEALDNEKTIGEIYPLGGPDRFTWPAMHRMVSRCIRGKAGLALPIPAWVGKFYAAIGIAPLLGFNRDQVVMSQEDNICDMTKFIADFGWTPQRFEPALREYAKEL